MRKRNIKINVFLNENEKQMLVEKSNKVRLYKKRAYHF